MTGLERMRKIVKWLFVLLAVVMALVWWVTTRPSDQKAFEAALSASSRAMRNAPPLMVDVAWVDLLKATDEAVARVGGEARDWSATVRTLAPALAAPGEALLVLESADGLFRVRYVAVRVPAAAAGFESLLTAKEGDRLRFSGRFEVRADGRTYERSLTRAGRAEMPELSIVLTGVRPG